jgi:hypothetical protein
MYPDLTGIALIAFFGIAFAGDWLVSWCKAWIHHRRYAEQHRLVRSARV